MGYRVASAQPDRGVIVTERRPALTVALWDGEHGYQRGYSVETKETAGRRVEVVATPLLFEVTSARGSLSKSREVPAETAWTVADEEAEWRRLFENVRRQLDAPAADRSRTAAE